MQHHPSSCFCDLISLTSSFFFFTYTATTEIYTLSLHDALPILFSRPKRGWLAAGGSSTMTSRPAATSWRSEEHTSELQSRQYLVCRLLLEKKKNRHACCNTT